MEEYRSTKVDASYTVSNFGNVKGRTGKIIKQKGKKYKSVHICRSSWNVDFLVATSFLEYDEHIDIEDLYLCSEINHIDCDLLNNNADNLQLFYNKYNYD